MKRENQAKLLLVVCGLIAFVAAGGNEQSGKSEEVRNPDDKHAYLEPESTEAHARDTARRVGELYKSESGSDYKLPSAQSSDAGGKVLLSWRVHLLPYLGEKNLYNRFHLDEPWDGEHNKELIRLVPKPYQTDRTLPEVKTTAVALVSENSAITPAGGIRFADITDGASNTILFVVADRQCAVTWTKPGDIQFDPDKPLRCLGKGGFFQALFCDGSVHRIPTTIDAETMRRLVNRRDGKPVSLAF